ncbi:MAG: J domain-containing protein [Acidimicrobiales bacterium]
MTTDRTTYYEVLHVDPAADQAEIRRAYHRAARRWHPDHYADRGADEAFEAEHEMRRVNEAWAVLGEVGKRAVYDRQLSGGGAAEQRRARTGYVNDDGVIRIDPRLLDPSFVQARRHAQHDEISNRSSVILRVAPVVVLLALLVGIFVFTAYARGSDATAASTTAPGPNLGEGVLPNGCVSILEGPALQPRPCDASADYQVIGARRPDGVCPPGTGRDLELLNGAIACLRSIG